MKNAILLIILILFPVVSNAQRRKVTTDVFEYGISNQGSEISIRFDKGKEHNHPLFAIWLTDENGHYIQTLYVSESIGKGVFRRVSRRQGMWLAGEIQRPASLPVWAHQRGITNEFGTFLPTVRHPVPDAYTGATPKQNFEIIVKTERPLSGRYFVMMEVNQSWDWNDYWHNNKFPDDKEYKTSSQPSVVYSVMVDARSLEPKYLMSVIGHGHYAGKDGSITEDVSTLTTALKIAKKIELSVKP